jgi:hypothetical protein
MRTLAKQPPLARYQARPVEFVHELTPLELTAPEIIVFQQFANGSRKALGLKATAVDGLMRSIYLSSALIAWRTLCFERQMTGVYAKSRKHASQWMTGMQRFVGGCDALISRQIRFGLEDPCATIEGDTYWRVMTFNPNESELEHARPHLTNCIYYDFDTVPEWLVTDTQHAVHNRPGSVSVLLSVVRDSRDRLPSPRSTWKPDESADTDD